MASSCSYTGEGEERVIDSILGALMVALGTGAVGGLLSSVEVMLSGL